MAAQQNIVLKVVNVCDLEVGMYVVKVLTETEHPGVYSKEGPISSREELEAIIRQGYVDCFVDVGEMNRPDSDS